MDVDGTLTDGTITYTADGTELKSFHARDGAGIRLLGKAGIAVAIVSGRASAATTKRAQELGIGDVQQGVSDKAGAVEALRRKHSVSLAEVAFVGDDLTDLPAMRAVGFAAAPADADPEVRRHAHYVCRTPGGRGAVREAIEVLLRRMGLWEGILDEHRGGATAPRTNGERGR